MSISQNIGLTYQVYSQEPHTPLEKCFAAYKILRTNLKWFQYVVTAPLRKYLLQHRSLPCEVSASVTLRVEPAI